MEFGFDAGYLPMRGNLAEPLQAGVFQANVRVEASGHGVVDDEPLLLIQELDELLLGPDVVPDPAIGMVEKADDRHLLIKWRKRCRQHPKPLSIEPKESGLTGAQPAGF